MNQLHMRKPLTNFACIVLLLQLLFGCVSSATPTRTSDFYGSSSEDLPTVTVSSTDEAEPTPDSPDISETAIPAHTTQQEPEVLSTETVTRLQVILNTVNVRAGPGTEFDVVHLLSRDDNAFVLDTSDDGSWYKIELEDGRVGWVGSSVVEIIDVVITPIGAALSDSDVSESESETATATPFPPVYVEVFNVNHYVNQRGTLWLYGEVMNFGSEPVKRIKLTATVYDEEGLVTAIGDSYARTPLQFSLWHTGVLHSGEYAPFSIMIRDPGALESWRITSTYTEARASDYSDHYEELIVLNDQGQVVNDFLGNYRITGEIQNIGNFETGPVRISTTLYDSEGRVIGVDGTATSEFDKLGPGEITPFSVLLFARGPVDSYRLFIRAIRHDQ
jgi:hypothetical protein